jgi:hypothetical protein
MLVDLPLRRLSRIRCVLELVDLDLLLLLDLDLLVFAYVLRQWGNQ